MYECLTHKSLKHDREDNIEEHTNKLIQESAIRPKAKAKGKAKVKAEEGGAGDTAQPPRKNESIAQKQIHKDGWGPGKGNL